MIAAPFVWAAIVFILHVIPIKPDSEPRFKIPHLDKAVHFTMFFVLSFLVYRAILVTRNFIKPQIKQLVAIVLFCMLYGALMEWLQGNFFNERDGDIYDWFADTAGTFIGLWLASTSFLGGIFNVQLRK